MRILTELARNSGPIEVIGSHFNFAFLAGIVFDESTGRIADSAATFNGGYGLVIQGSTQPSWQDEGNVFEANGQYDILIDGSLPVPPPPALPGG